MYVEVFYFIDRQYAERRFIHYNNPDQANDIYKKTIAKMKKYKNDTLICLRDDNHELIKSCRT